MGLIGLGPMGTNFAKNIARNKYNVSVATRSLKNTQAFIDSAKLPNVWGFEDYKPLVNSLETPRTLFLMVPSGPATDDILSQVWPHMDPHDTIIDCGNENWKITEERCSLSPCHHIGMGVSGGWRGALNGPSMMPGGDKEGWIQNEGVLRTLCANPNLHNWVGPGGAGHFTKMVHNGIEYAIMQSISEAWWHMHTSQGMSNATIGELFAKWQRNDYLLGITADILMSQNPDEDIVDEALSNGTGMLTVQCAMEVGCPVPTIAAAVQERAMSGNRHTRMRMNDFIPIGITNSHIDAECIRKALEVSHVLSICQGLELIRAKSESMGWDIDVQDVVKNWRKGSILESDVLQLFEVVSPYTPICSQEPVRHYITRRLDSLRLAVSVMNTVDVPCPALAASLSYIVSISSQTLPASLIQAQRYEFGKHPYCLNITSTKN